MNMLDGKLVIVTGGAQGIGLGCAKVFSNDGASVVIVDQNEGTLAQAVEFLTEDGFSVTGMHGDVSLPEDVDRIVATTLNMFGHIDGLVNNAGVSYTSPFLEHTLDDWRRVVDVNLTAVFLWSQRVLSQMCSQGTGSIVNISSLSALGFGSVSHAAYSASKAGVIALTREIAHEFASTGIRVNSILPGLIRTSMATGVVSSDGHPEKQEGSSAIRWGKPEDIGNAAAFLLSDRSSFITGTSLVVGGGAGLGITNPL